MAPNKTTENRVARNPLTKLVNWIRNGPTASKPAEQEIGLTINQQKFPMAEYTIPDGFPGKMRDGAIRLRGSDEATIADSMFKHLEYVATTFESGRYLMFRPVNGAVNLENAAELVHDKLIAAGLEMNTRLDVLDEEKVGYLCSKENVRDMFFKLIAKSIADSMKQRAGGIPGFDCERFVQEGLQDPTFVVYMFLDKEPYTIPDGLPGEMRKGYILLPGNQVRVADSILKHFKHAAGTIQSHTHLRFKPTKSGMDLKRIHNLVQQGLKDTEIGTRVRTESVDQQKYSINFLCAATKYDLDVQKLFSESLLEGTLNAVANVPGINKMSLEFLNRDKSEEWLFE